MLKTVSKEVVRFIPLRERQELAKNPEYKATAVWFKPMSKRDYDVYIASLTEFKRSRLVSKSNVSSKLLFEKCLAPSLEGIFIENAEIDGTFVEAIRDRVIAANFLLDLGDIETATEIELAMKGQSSLDEDEEKN